MKTILLADDSITIQKVVELTFSEGDYQVTCVSNGTEALKKIREVRPHIALLDIIMPEKNGYEVCEEIKNDPTTAGIPVLLLTGTFEPFDEKRAAAVGAVGHLTKPFESHALVSRVDELIAAGGGVEESNDSSKTPVQSNAVPESAPTAAAAPPSTASVVEQSPAAAPELPPPALVAPTPYSEETPSGSVPIGTPPDPEDGGSLQASAPFDLGSGNEEIIPDRFDDPSPSIGKTVQLSRAEVLAAQNDEHATQSSAATSSPQDLPMDGFVSGYEIPEPTANVPSAQSAAEVQGDVAAPALTQELIDRIAEQVVQRMSDRAVREIAWEVIPQVAEAIVRNRIKELEEQGEG